MPAHERTTINVEGEADVIQIFLRETPLNLEARRLAPHSSRFDSHDIRLQAAALQLFVAAARQGPDSGLLLDAGIRGIRDHLATCGDQHAVKRVSGGLAHAAGRRVIDLITSALDDQSVASPTLKRLAGTAELSINHFIRAFGDQMGVTPHRYIVLRRLERGIALLKAPGQSVANVADSIGFATPAHFVATFRRTMGVTPGAFRAALLS